jgi:hypothetical protein
MTEPTESTEPIAKAYDPSSIEGPLYEEWLERGYFRASAEAVLSGSRDPYVIVIPPPNVTSVLHMGHVLNNTLQDLLIRWRRMKGREALWIPGTDHAGIATQTVVEKRVMKEEGKRRTDFAREEFTAKKGDVWTCATGTEEESENAGEVVAAVDSIGDLKHYLRLLELVRSRKDVTRDSEFQATYRRYWRMNVARLGDGAGCSGVVAIDWKELSTSGIISRR